MKVTASAIEAVSLGVSVATLVTTLGIFFIGRRITFRQRIERASALEAQAWEVIAPMRQQGRNSKIIVMNVARYARGYDGSNELTLCGYAYVGHELIEIDHSGIQVIARASKSYYDASGRRTLTPTPVEGANVLEVGHIPWRWMEHIAPEGDEFDGSPIFFVRYKGPGHTPFHYFSFREAESTPFGPHQRAYHPPTYDLSSRRPSFIGGWWQFLRDYLHERKAHRRQLQR